MVRRELLRADGTDPMKELPQWEQDKVPSDTERFYLSLSQGGRTVSYCKRHDRLFPRAGKCARCVDEEHCPF